MSISDKVSIDCKYQRQSPGALICRAAVTQGQHSTKETHEEICFKCPAGKIYRELGCGHISPKLWLIKSMSGISMHRYNLRCSLRKRETTYDFCLECPYTGTEFTQPISETVTDFYEKLGFKNAKDDLQEARQSLGEGNNQAAIRAAVSATESTFKSILDHTQTPYPAKETVTRLWREVKKALGLKDDSGAAEYTEQIVGALSGAISGFAGLRNDLSDAHGDGLADRETSNSYAELAVNLAVMICLFTIRHFKIKGMNMNENRG